MLNDTLQFIIICLHHNLSFSQWTNTSFSNKTEAIGHTSRISMNAVNALFSGCVISWNGTIPCLPYTPSLTTCDFFYGGPLKQKRLRLIHREPSKSLHVAFGTRLKQFPLIYCERSCKTSSSDYENAMKVIWQTQCTQNRIFFCIIHQNTLTF